MSTNPRKILERNLFRNHLQVAALPRWAKAACDTSNLFTQENRDAPERPCQPSCPCHKIKAKVTEIEEIITAWEILNA